MEKDISLTIEALSDRDAEYLITSEKEIEFVLRSMADHEARVAIYYGGERYFFMSTILNIDHKGMWFEQSPNSLENERAVQSDYLVFVSSHLLAKVQFVADHARLTEYGKYPALYLPLPKSIYRLQRRDFFRLPAPISSPLRCSLDSKNAVSKNIQGLVVMDISVGGVGLVCTESNVEIAAGDSYQNCQIDLPEMGTVSGTLEVKNLTTSTSPSGHTHTHVGCEFKNLDVKSTNLLQRYVTKMQRTRSNLE